MPHRLHTDHARRDILRGMAHEQQRRFVALVDEIFLPENKAGLRVLEVGSYEVNGSNRQVFAGSHYIGADLCAGPGVDVVASGEELAFPDGTFDVTLSTECFEHNPRWRETFANMHRMTAPDGVLIVTCAGRGRLEHGTSRTTPGCSPGTQSVGSDYYRNLLPRDFKRLGLAGLFGAWHSCAIGADTYCIGWKRAAPAGLDEFRRRLPAIRVRGSLLWGLCYLPLTLAAYVVPERRFQDLGLAYSRGMMAMLKLGARWRAK